LFVEIGVGLLKIGGGIFSVGYLVILIYGGV
jgi:hypothetical protein